MGPGPPAPSMAGFGVCMGETPPWPLLMTAAGVLGKASLYETLTLSGTVGQVGGVWKEGGMPPFAFFLSAE